jgi:hypothetical protein
MFQEYDHLGCNTVWFGGILPNYAALPSWEPQVQPEIWPQDFSTIYFKNNSGKECVLSVVMEENGIVKSLWTTGTSYI